MNRVLSIMKDEGFQCLPCVPLNLDVERFQEYRDSDEHPAETPFERPPLITARKRVEELGDSIPTILRYFLDGSRRTYKIADVILDGRFLPLVAGQVGVAVVGRRDDSTGVQPLRGFCEFRNVIAFPNKVPDDDLKSLEDKINRPGSPKFHLLHYTVRPERDPVDLGVAKIMSVMHGMEIETVKKMAGQHYLGNDRLLVIDGPLRFKEEFDVVQFRNVIGLSKSFRPSFSVGKAKKQDVGYITSGLAFGERTSVFRTAEESKIIGMWYMRLRPPHRMTDPLQGVVKAECYAVDPEDRENGLDTERVDVISAHILRERNVTPFKADSRWASHIYPIYVAETYLKASYMSDVRFEALF